ncbi:hypothetical protein ABIC10_007237 [Bradyrhizobium sp. S3.2.12]
MNLLAGEDGHNERTSAATPRGTRCAIQPSANGAERPPEVPREVSDRTGASRYMSIILGARRAARERLCIPEIDKAGVFRRARMSWCAWYEAHCAERGGCQRIRGGRSRPRGANAPSRSRWITLSDRWPFRFQARVQVPSAKSLVCRRPDCLEGQEATKRLALVFRSPPFLFLGTPDCDHAVPRLRRHAVSAPFVVRYRRRIIVSTEHPEHARASAGGVQSQREGSWSMQMSGECGKEPSSNRNEAEVDAGRAQAKAQRSRTFRRAFSSDLKPRLSAEGWA